MRKFHVIAIGLLVTLAALSGGDSLSGQDGEEPTPGTEKGRPAASHPALNDPDRFAWELFVRISRPADQAQPNGPVFWESWANARKVFEDPHNAPAWPAGPPAGNRHLSEFEPEPLQQLAARSGDLTDRPATVPLRPAIDPAVLFDHGNETRLNREAFDFVVENDLYYVEGQEAFFNAGLKINFPIEAQEIKAQWRKITPEQAPRYHSATVENDRGEQELWGLTALHITTKDLPNWFWATFEHRENSGREAVVPSRDTFGIDEKGGTSAQLTELFRKAKLGRKWENYILRGTQVDFVDSTGRPTILANSQIEEGFQDSSSCITCHARATIGPRPGAGRASRLSVFESRDPLRGSIGAPDPAWFTGTGTFPPVRRFSQMDFVWSLFRAGRRIPVEPPSVQNRNDEPDDSDEEN